MRDKENAEVWKGNEPESLAERFFFSRGLPLDDEGLSCLVIRLYNTRIRREERCVARFLVIVSPSVKRPVDSRSISGIQKFWKRRSRRRRRSSDGQHAAQFVGR